MSKNIPHNLMKGRCRFCGRPLRYANIPNRGPVMAHATGDGAHCRRMQAMGRDLITRAAEDEVRKTARLSSASPITLA